MPQIKSAIKRVKTQENARERNIAQLNAMRTAVKKFKSASEQNADNSQDLYKAATRAIDMANSKGRYFVHKGYFLLSSVRHTRASLTISVLGA